MGCKLTISSESVGKQQGLGRADSAMEQLNTNGLLTSCSATFLTAPVTASATAPVDLTYEKGLTKKVYKIQMAFANYQNHPKPADTHGGTEDDALQIICRLWLEGPGQVHDGVSMSSLLREQNEAMPCKHFTAANGATSVDPLVRPAPLAQKEKFIENWL